MTDKGQNVEIELKYDVSVEQLEDGWWYVMLNGSPIGDGFREKDVPLILRRWIPSLVNSVADIISDGISDWYVERSKP